MQQPLLFIWLVRVCFNASSQPQSIVHIRATEVGLDSSQLAAVVAWPAVCIGPSALSL